MRSREIDVGLWLRVAAAALCLQSGSAPVMGGGGGAE